MSIVASVKVRDGIILGADSATQIQGEAPDGQRAVVKIYYNAQKLFSVPGLPMGILTYGVGNIGKRSVPGVLTDFADGIDPKTTDTVKDVSGELRKHLSETYEKELPDTPEDELPQLGVFVAGYSREEPHPEEWELQYPQNPNPRSVRDADEFGASWRGVSIPFSRLYQGIDPRLKQELMSRAQDEAHEQLTELFRQSATPVIFDGMPLQDAVRYNEFILRTTIWQAQFEAGAASCGGPLILASITRKDGFEWIVQPELRPSTQALPKREPE